MNLLYLLLSSLMILISFGHASINGHSNKMVSIHHSKDFMDTGVCLQEATCIQVQNATCFGTILPYTFTSIALAEDSISQFEVQDNLGLWQGLRSVPRCWAVIQPFLCAIYMPKCENGSVFLPSQEMCRITRGPCKSVEVKHSWPSFLRCENKNLFPSHCRNPLQEVKFNTSYKCIPPLVETDNSDNWFHEVEGCGIQCQNPLFTEEEHSSTHKLIGSLASISFAMTIFTVLTFLVSWKASNKYPGVIIFYINMCLGFVFFCWLIQFFPGAREELVCSNDGTMRRRQPRAGQHLCSITFAIMYFFLIASIVWFVILTYAWHTFYICFYRQSGTPKDIVQKKVSYFHIAAWSIPLILTTTVMSMAEVDGDSMSGICFVGYANMNIRIGFLLAPVCVAAGIGIYFLSIVLYTLVKVKVKSEEIANLNHKSWKKIRRLILKIGVFTAFSAVLIACTVACHCYDFQNRKEWDESLREYIVCLAMNSANRYSSMEELPKCQLRSKPNVVVVRLHLICVFIFGIIMSVWVWTKKSLEAWKCFLYGLCEPSDKNAVKLKRHKIISKAFKHRHEINQGHISFSLNSTHDDPLDLNLDANSVASRDISSSWAAALPQFIARRNALAGAIMPFAPRHYSSASDVSRHISVDSFNQPNLDSLSMQISEHEFVAHALRHQRRKTRKERERFLMANRIAPWFPGSRRGSDTSLQSSLMAASIAAAAKKAAVGGATVTKATSTGDLDAVPLPPPSNLPPVLIPPLNNRPHIQRQVVNPPFTHGMTDNSHCLDRRVRSVASPFIGADSNQRFSPNQCSVIPNPLMGMVRPSMCTSNFEVQNSMPYGLLGVGMYPSVNGMYPNFSFGTDYGYNPYSSLPYTSYTPYTNQYQQNVLPMPVTIDSASEAEFFPIIMSDSEFTDTGHRSYDESHLLTAQLRLMQMQEQMQAQVAIAATAIQAEPPQSKPVLEPQACAKTQFLKRMGSFNSKTNTTTSDTSGRKTPHTPSGRKTPQPLSDRKTPQPLSDRKSPQSPSGTKSSQLWSAKIVSQSLLSRKTPQTPPGRKSPHSEAPPPSPNESSTSLNVDSLDDVFVEPEEKINHLSTTSLPQSSEKGVLEKVKSTLRRATSFAHYIEVPNSEAIKLSSKPSFISLCELSKVSSFVDRTLKKDVRNELWYHESEGESLISCEVANENVSR